MTSQLPKTEHHATVTGGCHCGRVRFSALAEIEPVILVCNCSICAKIGYRHLIVPHQHFTLLLGQDCLTSYRFGSQTAQHLFCQHCGIKSFYQPRSHPQSWSLAFDCLDDTDKINPVFQLFDGRDWDRSAKDL